MKRFDSLRRRFAGLHFMQAALVACSAGAFVAVVVPLQTFLGNRGMFAFSPGEVCAEAFPAAALVAACLFACMVLSEPFAGRLAHVAVVAALLCAYLETGPLSIGLPPIDGEIRVFRDPVRLYADNALLALALCAVFVFFRRAADAAHWIALAVLALGAASLLDVRSPAEAASASSPLSSGFCPQLDVVGSVRFSPKRNVVVLVLDSTPASVASAVAKGNADIRAGFPGFTAYENNIAMHEMTSRGLPGLMTGNFLGPDVSASDYASGMFGEESLLMPYVRAGDPVYFAGDMLSYGYTNRRLGDFAKVGESRRVDGPVFLRNSSEIPYVSLLDVVKFRLAPYRRKPSVLAKACSRVVGRAVKKQWANEDVLYPMVSASPTGQERRTALCVLHSDGLHDPVTRDRHGKALPAPAQDAAAHYEYGVYLMRNVAGFLAGLRERGVYDSSLIVLAADHGLASLSEGGCGSDASKGHGAESAILWVKPVGAAGEMKFSRTPTSNCRIAALVKESEARDLSESEVDGILRAENRRFVAKHGTRWWSFGRLVSYWEWTYDDEGRLVSCEDKGVFRAN